MDPIMLIMFALLAVLIFFMFRNSKKRQQQAQEMQSNLRPGAEVMLTSGIFGTVEELEDGAERVVIRSGTTTIEVHRQAIAKVVTPVAAAAEAEHLAPDDDPEFNEHIASEKPEEVEIIETEVVESDAEPSDDEGGDSAPKQ